MRYLSVRNMLLLAVLAAVAFPAVSEGGWLFRWWQRPPVLALPDLTFDEVDATRARLYCFAVSNRRVQGRQEIKLADSSTDASLVDGQLSIGDLLLQSNGDSVEVSFDPANVKGNIFGSAFYGKGTALVSLDEGEPDEIDIKYHGTILERKGNFILKAQVVGYGESSSNGTRKVFLFSCNLGGTGTPDEEEPE